MEQSAVSTATQTRVAVLADDLIWSSRLIAAAANAGAQPVVVKDAAAIDAPFAVIDLGGRAYDGIAAVQTAASAGATVLAVAQHEDVDQRKLALAAGAKRVLSYNKLFNDGPNVIARLIEGAL
jgi:Zn-dependent alcohol dehydrogenase